MEGGVQKSVLRFDAVAPERELTARPCPFLCAFPLTPCSVLRCTAIHVYIAGGDGNDGAVDRTRSFRLPGESRFMP